MAETVCGDPAPPCRGIRRPARLPRQGRPPQVRMPLSWKAIAFEYWGCDQASTWQSWQSLSACGYSEVRQFVQLLAVWPSVTTGYNALVDHRIAPAAVVKVLELALAEGHLSPALAQILEDKLLACVDVHGQWTL